MQYRSMRRVAFLAGAAASFLVSLYGLLGFFQAVMLFTGLRALKNSNIWASVFLVGVALSVFCVRAARRLTQPSPPVGVSIPRLSFLAICGLLSVGAMWRLATDYAALDSCLDLGGSFNYVRSVCDFTSTHPAVSVFSWRGVFITAAVVFGLPLMLEIIRRRSPFENPRHAL